MSLRHVADMLATFAAKDIVINAILNHNLPSPYKYSLETGHLPNRTSDHSIWHPWTKSTLPKSILVQFQRGKQRNPSIGCKQGSSLFRFCLIAPVPSRNCPLIEVYFDFVHQSLSQAPYSPEVYFCPILMG